MDVITSYSIHYTKLYEEIQAETHLVEFVVSSGKSPIVGASVSFNGKVLVTDETGLVQFSDVLTGSKMPYVVIKDGYGEFDDYIDVEADVNHQVELDITNIEEGESVQFKVFPNPTKGSISVNVPILKFATYELYSLSGSLVRTGVLLDVENDLDLSSLSSGSYLLRVYYEQKVENVKVILQK